LAEKATYRDGVLDGPYEQYHENGQLEVKGTYTDEGPDGPYERYFDNGELWMKGTYNMGERCGEWVDRTSVSEIVTYPPCPPDLEGED